jgi:thiamine kinase-like enzyme
LFTKVFERFDPRTLHVTIPHFHDLSLRYKQFETSVAAGNRERVAQCASEIELLQSFFYLVKEYEAFVGSPHAKLRVTHHDTKISNVLFNDLNKGICVIDLDTVMPGYFFWRLPRGIFRQWVMRSRNPNAKHLLNRVCGSPTCKRCGF